MKILVQLTLWVKDQRRLDIDAEFPNGTLQAVFVEAIETAQQRDKIRKARQKSAEGLASVRIDPPLKSSAGWEAWMVSVERDIINLSIRFEGNASQLHHSGTRSPRPERIRATNLGGICCTWDPIALRGSTIKLTV
jgi:hypothetical protein